jgi:Fibronectin type III domain
MSTDTREQRHNTKSDERTRRMDARRPKTKPGRSSSRSGLVVSDGALASRRHLRVLLAAVCVMVGALMLTAGVAQAKLVRPNTGKSFGPEGLGAGTFGNVKSVAVDQSSGDVYVFDQGREAIFKFDAAGEPVDFSSTGTNEIEGATSSGGGPEQQIAVDGSAGPDKGDIYLATNEVVDIYSSAGVKLGELTGGEACGVAVDTTGAVYVGFYPATVSKYVPSSNPVSNVDETESLSGLPSICNVAVDGEGSVYAATYSGGVHKYSALQFGALEAEGTLIDEHGRTLAADPTTNHALVDEGARVAEFNAAGEPELVIGENELEGSLGVAINATSNDAYIDGPSGRVEIFGAPVAEPDVSTEASTNVTATTATLNGTVNPEGQEVTECFFEYGEEASYGKTAPCVETVGSGTSPVPVHADITGLEQLTTYHYRLVTKDAIGQTVAGADQTLTTAGPGVSTAKLDETGTTYAVVSASIDPNNAPTTYHVDYGETSAYGSSTAESPSVGTDAALHTVTTTITGLKPGTTYHFRFVATNADGTAMSTDTEAHTYVVEQRQTDCSNESLRYGYGADLPDCRAYEQATPVDKDGTNAQLLYNTVQASADGGAVTFFTQAGVPGGTGAGQLPIFLSSRGVNGWTTQGMLPAGRVGQSSSAVLGWTPSLSEVFDSEVHVEPPGRDFVLEARNTADGSVRPISTSTEHDTFEYVGASSDGRLVYFEISGAKLTPEAIAEKKNVYVWDRATGALSLVGVLPDSACGSPPCTPAGGSVAGPYNWFDGEGAGGGATDTFFLQAENAVSSDGLKAYFTAGETGQLYVRENPASAGAVTAQVSASQKTNGTGPGGTDPNGPRPAAFMMATPDGSKAFFTSPEELTNDANTGTSDDGNDLYRYEPASGALTDLTPDAADPNGAEVKGVLGVSEDGSYVYFAANGDLDGAGPGTLGNCVAEANDDEGWQGACSLYLWHDGETRFVATLNPSGSTAAHGLSDAADWLPRGRLRTGNAVAVNTARVSSDGHVVLFRSQNRLTAYDNHGVPEFYRYDAETGQLGCVSCNPSGALDAGRPMLQTETAFIGLSGLAGIQSRNLSASGDQFFFETGASLLPRDTNGTTDVYEWEADSAGSCENSADEGGCLYLLSTGKSPDPSNFADASASGDEAFLFTDQPLVGQDEDQLVDVYDVRVDGGLASQNPPAAASCDGEECKLPANTSLAPPFVASVTFSGPNNQPPSAGSPAKAATVRRTLHATVRTDRFFVSVSAPGKGRITISGAGVRTLGRSVTGAGRYRLRVQLTPTERRLLRRRHSLRLALRIVYAPSAAGSAGTGQ